MAHNVEALRVDDYDMPSWAEAHLKAAQLELGSRTRWVLLIDSAPLRPTTKHVALRLHVYMLGADENVAWPSVVELARCTGLSDTTVRSAIGELEEAGWLAVHRTLGFHANRYYLAWPAVDVTGRRALPDRCAAPTDDGGAACSRRAGWGTATPGTGPCSLHGGEPRRRPNPSTADGSNPSTVDGFTAPSGVTLHPQTPQPLTGDPSAADGITPQPLGQTPQPLTPSTSVVHQESSSREFGAPDTDDDVRVTDQERADAHALLAALPDLGEHYQQQARDHLAAHQPRYGNSDLLVHAARLARDDGHGKRAREVAS